MRQAIHIFRKDARHCWPYIAGVLAIAAVSAWQESVVLGDPRDSGPNLTGILLAFLMVLAWWFAVGAAVHGESLIGDRQFWTTRPYSWVSLLAAKLLFVAAFLGLPLFLSDCTILLASGFNPLALVPGLLWRQCWFVAFLALPFVMAALTRATRELALAGLVFYVVVCIALASLSNHAIVIGVARLGRPPWIWDLAPWLMPAAGFSLILWQYARRRTTRIRVLAIALGGLAPLMITMSLGRMASSPPFPRQDDRVYRNVTVQLAAGSGEANAAKVDRQTRGVVRIPVKFSGWPRDLANCLVTGVAATEPGAAYPGTSPLGVSASPGFISNTTTITSGGCESIGFSIDDIKTKSTKTVDLWVSVFLRLYQRQGRVDIPVHSGWAQIPGFGNVRWLEDAHVGHLIWRTALEPGTPGGTYSLSNGSSEFVSDAEWPGLVNWPASPGWFAISPVYSYVASGLTLVHAGLAPSVLRGPISPLVFTSKRLVAILRRELKVPNVRLSGDETK